MRRAFKPKGLYVFGIICIILLQGCSALQERQDESEQKTTLIRWNQCLERAGANAEHYCEGHRRDVIASFPHYMEGKLTHILQQQTHTRQATKGLETDQRRTFDAKARDLLETLRQRGFEPKQVDL